MSTPGRCWCLVLHGGAGTIGKQEPKDVEEIEAALRKCLQVGVGMLQEGGKSIDAVEAVVKALENCPWFNAGKGSVSTSEGKHELEASIMDGRTLSVGCVSLLKTVKNPISLARVVMEKTPHCFLAGEGAEAVADAYPELIQRVGPEHFWTERRHSQFLAWKQEDQRLKSKSAEVPPPVVPKAQENLVKREGQAQPNLNLQGEVEVEGRATQTVGCVCLDLEGNVAAATSTGGFFGKLPGRIGDSPLIGAGTYANNLTCAVSGTGKGEKFIRHVVAGQIHGQMAFGKKGLAEATKSVVWEQLDKGDGGVIAVSVSGEYSMEFNSTGMYRAWAHSNGETGVKIWQ